MISSNGPSSTLIKMKIIGLSLLLSITFNSNAQENKHIEIHANDSIFQIPSCEIATYKVVEARPTFHDGLSEEDKSDFQDHLDMMEESAYICFTSDSTFAGSNGLFEMDCTYTILGDTFATKNGFGFPADYIILEFNASILTIVSHQDDLELTLFYKAIPTDN